MTKHDRKKSNDASDAVDVDALERMTYDLTPAQETGLDALLSGQSVTDAAQTAGVARQTVSGWLNHDPVFIAAYNRRRQLHAEHFNNRLRALSTKALDALTAELDGDRRLDAAKTVLRLVASLPPPAPDQIKPMEVENEHRRRALYAVLHSSG